MATINKPKKKSINYPKRGKNKEIWDLYNTTRWKNLRKWKLMTNPLCECCLKALTEEVHHIQPISTGETQEEREQLAYNPSNLIGLCKECHDEIHRKLNKNE